MANNLKFKDLKSMQKARALRNTMYSLLLKNSFSMEWSPMDQKQQIILFS